MSTVAENVVALKNAEETSDQPKTGSQSIQDKSSFRPEVRGKFLFVGDEKFWIKGVTYGTFKPGEGGHQFPDRETVEADFKAMAANGINTVRTYTPPPRWFLDEALSHGLKVMVGLPWEQHVTFLDDKALTNKIEARVSNYVESLAGHPALLCIAIGNEIPPAIVRWHGRKKIEKFLHRLYDIVKDVDADALVTYVNFPTTEYLQLNFLDLVCFNVYLEEPEKLEAYLARLQNIAGERPLLMAEIGLDSKRNGDQKQAESLQWQIRTAFNAGCIGAFVFAWTDEWYRGGYDIEDWDFGLTTRDRQPKPALSVVKAVFADVPFPSDTQWPKVSVVCCSYNGSSTIRDTLEALKTLPYPNFEVIVVNDGSTDATADIASEYDVRLISTENRGLSNARNTGWQEATGEIVAYIDDDAYPDPHWLHYLAHTYMTTDFAGVGGPNLCPPGDGPIADCVYNAPGGPVQVLLTDTVAEHVPGCNMTFRREALEKIGGFDPRYRAAGDDVDVCWRVQENVGQIGFHAAAMDWHHRRNSVKTYWKQQQGYGKAEALLEEKWPEKYNAMGHFSWSGRLYGTGFTEAIKFKRPQVYGGPWGSALFQSIYQPATGLINALPLMPEWFLLVGLLGVLSFTGIFWSPALWFIPLFVLSILAPVVQVVLSAMKAEFPTPWSESEQIKLRALTAVLHIMQPIARLKGRLQHGLTPWRKRINVKTKLRFSFGKDLWNDQWSTPESWLEALSDQLKQMNVPVLHGGDFDNWDLELQGGLLGSARVLLAIEEHKDSKQLLRFRVRPKFSPTALVVSSFFIAICALSFIDHAYSASIIYLVLGLILIIRMIKDYMVAGSVFADALRFLYQGKNAG